MTFVPFTEKNEEEKNWNLLDPELYPDPDPLSRKRIRIRIKMKRIRNTG